MDKTNEYQKSGILQVHNYSVAKGKKIQIVINNLIDWLLFNLDEIKKYIKEMDFLGASAVYGTGIGDDDIDIMEKTIIDLDEAKKIVKSVENAISGLDEQFFDIYIGRYCNELIYSQIAEAEGISEVTVKRVIKQIRQTVSDGFDQEEITFDSVFCLRKKLSGITLKKVS
jgi:DNA-directed RNA polymerase specialized sigma24 family protein